MARKKPEPGRMVKTSVPGIYKRNGGYVVRVYNPRKGNGGGRDDYTAPTFEAAKQIKRDREQIRRKSTGLVYTVAEWIGPEGLWFDRFPRRRESTGVHNRQQVKAFAREHADTPLDRVTEEQCVMFARAHPSHVPVLRAAFNDARRMKQIDENPWGVVEVKKSRGRKDITVLTEAELARLIATAERQWGDFGRLVLGPMIAVAAGTGCRPGENFALTRDEIDLEAGEVYIWRQWNNRTRKLTSVKGTRMDRRVAMLPVAVRALERLEYPDLEFVVDQTRIRPIWVTPREAPFKHREMSYYWPRVRDAFTASLPEHHHLQRRLRKELPGGRLDFHELRHFYGTALARMDCTVFEIEDQMGHNDAETIRTYIHLASEDVRDSVRAKIRRAA